MNELVSIIVPVYNVEKYLNRCVESIVNQTYKNLEIILVDDGSSDKCSAMCDKWALRDDRIKVIHKKNGGVSSARNVALDIAKGDLICFVDGDDYVSTEMCEKAIRCIEEQDVEMAIFNANMVTDGGNQLGVTEKMSEGVFLSEEIMYKLMIGDINHYAWNKIYSRRLFEEVRFPEGRCWEDMATIYKTIKKETKIYCCPEALYFYVQRPNSIVHTINEKALKDIFLARYDCYYGIKNEYPEVEKYALANMATSALHLYDRSLWAEVDGQALQEAVTILRENKKKIMVNCENKWMQIYMVNPDFYRVLRKAKHLIGNLLKKARN